MTIDRCGVRRCENGTEWRDYKSIDTGVRTVCESFLSLTNSHTTNSCARVCLLISRENISETNLMRASWENHGLSVRHHHISRITAASTLSPCACG